MYFMPGNLTAMEKVNVSFQAESQTHRADKPTLVSNQQGPLDSSIQPRVTDIVRDEEHASHRSCRCHS